VAGQDAKQDRNDFPAMTLHSGTAKTAEIIKHTGQPSGAANVNITNGTTNMYIWPSGAVTTAMAVHYRIRESKEFMAFYDWADIADGGTVNLHISTGTAKTAHGNLIVESDVRTKISLYENPSLSSNGTAVTAYCMNREIDGTAVTSVYHTAVVGTAGTKLECGMLGAAGKFSVAEGDITGAYWLMDAGESYILEMVNNSGTTSNMCVKYQWHEHPAA